MASEMSTSKHYHTLCAIVRVWDKELSLVKLSTVLLDLAIYHNSCNFEPLLRQKNCPLRLKFLCNFETLFETNFYTVI